MRWIQSAESAGQGDPLAAKDDDDGDYEVLSLEVSSAHGITFPHDNTNAPVSRDDALRLSILVWMEHVADFDSIIGLCLLAKERTDCSVRVVALEALAKLSIRTAAVARSPDVARFVSAALRDPDPLVRAAAEATAKRLNELRQ
jgi:hypothetical protein